MSRTTLFIVVALAAISSHSAYGQEARLSDQLPPVPAGKTWKLVWHDEFNGTKLNEAKWEVMPDAPRKGGRWSPKAVSLNGKGHLLISTVKDGDKFLDGCVRTKGRFFDEWHKAALRDDWGRFGVETGRVVDILKSDDIGPKWSEN